jgi:8-oxo-dGTP pyrophosphatase MutT (NUDIX family)
VGKLLFTAADVATRLSSLTVRDPEPILGRRRAAVACVLRFERGQPEVLLMRRAEHPGDRWSGHVSFPGGREDRGDRELLTTAVRETREELGLDLAAAPLLGRTEPVRAVAKGEILPMTISPFVFEWRGEPTLSLSAEAVEAFWLPLDVAHSGVLDDRYDYRLGPLPMKLPCWRFEGRVIWGLTYQMLTRFLEVVQP